MYAILKTALVGGRTGLLCTRAQKWFFYERESFQGQSFTAERQLRSLDRAGFSDRASSAVVVSGQWKSATANNTAAAAGSCVPDVSLVCCDGLNDRVHRCGAVSANARVDRRSFTRLRRLPPAPLHHWIAGDHLL